MWQTKTFKTQQALTAWIEKHGHKHQWETVYINNGYGVTYKPLRRVY